MINPGEPPVGGDPGPRAARDARAQAGQGRPDAAIGPEDRTLPEPMDLSNSEEGRRIEQKLRAEAQARRAVDDDAAVDDPTGHA